MQARNTGFSDPIRYTQSQEESPERAEEMSGGTQPYAQACLLLGRQPRHIHTHTHSSEPRELDITQEELTAAFSLYFLAGK